MLFGKAADPEIDAVDALDDAGAIGLHRHLDTRVDRLERGDIAGLQHEIRIGLAELVDHHLAEAVAGLEILPGRVGRHVAGKAACFRDVRILGGRQIHADLVERSEPDIPSARHIEGEQIGIDANEVVTNSVDDVEVHLFGLLGDDPAENGVDAELFVARLRHISRRQGTGEHAGLIARVQEGIEQSHLLGLPVGADDGHGLADQRMSDAIDRRCELMRDAGRCIRVVFVEAVGAVTTHAAEQHVGELVEDHPLVFGLVDHLGRLEQLFRRSLEAGRLQTFHMEVMVAGPDGVHRGQREVLVAAPVADHIVIEQLDEGVGVEKQRMGAAHEVGRHGRKHRFVDDTVVDQPGKVGPECHLPARQRGRVEERVVLPVVQDQFTQRRQQIEVAVRRIRRALKQMRAETARTVAFPQELADQLVGTIGLVLVSEGRGLVQVLRYAVDDRVHRPAGQIGRVARSRCAVARCADADRAVATLAEEVEPVVEVLAERHEEDVGVLIVLRQVEFLTAEDVADVARVEPREDRIDVVVAGRRVVGAVMRIGDADERFVSRTERGMGGIVAVAGQVTHPRNGVVVARNLLASDQVQQPRNVAISQRKRTGDTIAVVTATSTTVGTSVVTATSAAPVAGLHKRWRGPVRQSRERDRMVTVRQDRRAVGEIRARVIGKRRTGRQLDDILWPQRTDDGVMATHRLEDDAVRRGQCRDIDRIVTRRTIDRDGVGEQCGRREIADDLEGIDTTATGDLDLLDIGKFRDNRGTARDHDLGGCRDRDAGRDCIGPGIDPEGLGVRVAHDPNGVGVAAAIDDVTPFGGADDDQIIAAIAKDRVVARTAIENVVATAAVDRVVAGPAIEDVVVAIAENGVVAIATIDSVGPAACVDRVTAAKAGDGVVATVARDRIGSRRAHKNIGGTGANDGGWRHRWNVGADGCRRKREHLLKHAVGILINHAQPDRQSVLRVGDREARAMRALHFAGSEGFDVCETGAVIDLPEIGDRECRDDSARIVRIGQAGHAYCQHIADLDAVGGRVVNENRPAQGLVVPGAEHDGLIAEFQPLDVAERVRPIRPDIVPDRQGAVSVGRDGVVRARARELGRVEIGGRRCQDLAHDPELARIVGAVQHERDHRFHAIERSDFIARAVNVCPHADAHVQPAIAINDVVAAAALDDIAAGPPEDDVATIEEGRAGRKQRPQTGDQVDIGQHTARGACGAKRRGIGIVAIEDIAEARAGKAFDEIEAAERGRPTRNRRLIEEAIGDVDVDAGVVVFVHRPIVAGAADVAIAEAGLAGHDVVAAFAVELVVLAVADEDVVADDRVIAERIEIVSRGAVGGALLDPVVALVAHILFVGLAAQDEVVALAANGLRCVFAGDDEIAAEAADDQVDAVAAMEDVVAVATLDVVVATRVGDDVVAGAATQLVVAIAAVDAVVAGITPDGIVAFARDQDVIAGSTAENDMLVTGVAEIVAVRSGSIRVVADDERQQRIAVGRVVVAVDAKPGVLRRLVYFEREAGGREDDTGQMRRIRVRHDQLGEGIALEFSIEAETCGALEIVEAVTILQLFELILENEVEGGAQHAAKRHLLLGETADPQIDGIDASDGHAVGAAHPVSRTVQEVEAVGRCTVSAKDQRHGRSTLGRQCRGARDRGMRAVSGNEVDQRIRVFQALNQVRPTGVGLEQDFAGRRVDLPTDLVQRWNAGVTTAREVDRGKVERQAEQVVAQRLGDELVDLVAGLAGHAAHDRADCLFRIGAAGSKGKRVQEGSDQPQLLIGIAGVGRDDTEVGREAVDRFGQHRMAEAIDGVRELRDDRGIEVDVIDLCRCEEEIDIGLDGPGELLEDQMLILHLGTEFRGLEQALAIPLQSRNLFGCRRECGRSGVFNQPFLEEGEIARAQHRVLGLLDQPVMLGMEDRVDRGEADILVHAAVAGDVVRVEKLVVIGQIVASRSDGNGISGLRIAIGRKHTGVEHRYGIVRDVVEEGMAGAHRVREADRSCRIAFDKRGDVVSVAGNAIRPIVDPHHNLREAIRPLDEIAVGVGGQQRDVVEIGVGEVDAKNVARLGLHHFPGRHSTDFGVVSGSERPVGAEVPIGDQPARRNRITGGVELIATQEDLVRGMRGIGLVLVDERRGRVGMLVNVVGCPDNPVWTWLVGRPGQDHEVSRATGNKERVILLERDEHRAGAALGHEIETVVEELAEEGHPGVERRGQACIRRDVRDFEDLLVVARAELTVETWAGDDRQAEPLGNRVEIGLRRRNRRRITAGFRLGKRLEGDRDRCGIRRNILRSGIAQRRCDGGRVVHGLVDDQVADRARLRVDHQSARLLVGGAPFCGLEHRCRDTREDVVGRAEGLALGVIEQVVAGTIDGTQAQRHTRVWQQRGQRRTIGIRLGDLDLVEDEVEIRAHQHDALAARRCIDDRDGRDWRGNRGSRGDRHSRSREHCLGDAMAIGKDRLHAQSRSNEIGGHPEGGAIGALESEIPEREQDDIFEDA
ncbi:hypothetical protein LPJGGPFB_06590 [Ensifer adhaerens]|nr:hypothetical protein [Ensifer adhaerens]